jgi:hypothetical protein
MNVISSGFILLCGGVNVEKGKYSKAFNVCNIYYKT